ncbi:MAG: lytic transglycosylase domain-containing protein [Anaerolineales bacterium]|nr:MAG: lytic transglycosylase domain-containing protein [Anaerolineales bacterium]
MWIGPGLVVRGLFIGIVAVIFLTKAISTDASTLEKKNDGIDVSVSPGEYKQDRTETSDHTENELLISCGVSKKFPEGILKWCPLITEHSVRVGLEPNLIAALIWQESGGDQYAYSRSGAVGLMQVMPKDGIAATFMCVNGPCFSKRPTIKELENPDFNIKYGTKMLSQLLNKKGNLRDALKAYGPMDVGYSYADKVIGLYKRYGK